MSNLSKRSTVYFEEGIHQALKMKAAISNNSISEIVNNALRHTLSEDKEDIQAFNDRVSEPTMSYESLLDDLTAHGKI